MSTHTFTVYEVDSNYYDFEDGFVLGADTLTITDTDNLLHASSATDPGSDQSFDFAGEPSVSGYDVSFLDYTQVNLSGPSLEAFTMIVNFSDGSTKFYVMSKDDGFSPSVGDRLTVTSYSTFENTDYGTIGAMTCFVSGTRIATPSGLRPIEDLGVGDLVNTADHGPQAIRWIAHKVLSKEALRLCPRFRPILIRPAFASGLQAPLFVSPQHRMVLRLPDGCEWFVSAKLVADELPRLARRANGKREVQYYHLLFDRHEVIFAEGAPTESMYLGRTSLTGLDRSAQTEVFQLFPQAALNLFLSATSKHELARPVMRRHQLRTFVKEGLLENRAQVACA